MVTVLCVLYPDPIVPHPTRRTNIPKIECYPDRVPLPQPTAIDFAPGCLLGSVTGGLGLRSYIEGLGHKYVVTSDKDGEFCEFEDYLGEADIIISQPFWPAYLDRRRLERARKLRLVITAGIGSDHIDLEEASRKGITVAEITYSNSISVAEHAVMMILALVRNYLPSNEFIRRGGWNIADCAQRAYDVEGMQVGIFGAGRIGRAVLKRLKAFDVHLHYYDQSRLPAAVEQSLDVQYHESLDSLAGSCDILSIHAPLHPGTREVINDALLLRMRPGSYLINTARAEICNQQAIVSALETGQLAGYAGDVWYPQPPSPDHPWRSMPWSAMTPHVSGTTLPAQARYAAGTREVLECYFEKRPIPHDYLITQDGRLIGVGAKSYTLKQTH